MSVCARPAPRLVQSALLFALLVEASGAMANPDRIDEVVIRRGKLIVLGAVDEPSGQRNVEIIEQLGSAAAAAVPCLKEASQYVLSVQVAKDGTIKKVHIARTHDQERVSEKCVSDRVLGKKVVALDASYEASLLFGVQPHPSALDTYLLDVKELDRLSRLARARFQGKGATKNAPPVPAASKPPSTLSCRDENARQMLACDPTCSTLIGAAYDDCLVRCMAANGYEYRKCP